MTSCHLRAYHRTLWKLDKCLGKSLFMADGGNKRAAGYCNAPRRRMCLLVP
jgi:hypothetical protein